MAIVTSDVIASASLLMALVAALFGLWHVEIDRALREASPTGDVARKVVRDRVGLVLWNKALPLAVSAIAVAAVFFPRSLAIGVSSFALIGREWRYNDLMAAFILTEIVLVALAILTALRAARLFKKWITLT